MTEVAYMVRYWLGANNNILCEKLFNERWQAEAFRDSCPESMRATVVLLYEQAK